MKDSLLKLFSICLLLFGVVSYIYPIFFDYLGNYSGMVSFIIVFIGVTLLKYRKDQLNKKE